MIGFFAIAYWNISLLQIRKMIIYSIEDSTLDNNKKEEYIKKFDRSWDKWKDNYNLNGKEESIKLNDIYLEDIKQMEKFCKLSQELYTEELKYQKDFKKNIDENNKKITTQRNPDSYFNRYLKYKQKYLNLKQKLYS